MDEDTKEDGVILALIERFERQRLPRILELKERVDKGELLDESDMEFLEGVIADAVHNKPLDRQASGVAGILRRGRAPLRGDHGKGVAERAGKILRRSGFLRFHAG